MSAVFAYVTAASTEEAQAIGRALVAERLAACVNILPGMVSHYRWQGKIERGEEAVMILKTRAALAEQLCAAVKAGHPYSNPAILTLAPESVAEGYLRWILAETGAAG